MTEIENSSTPDDEKERANLELRRLRAEVERAEVDARFALRMPRLELLKVTLTSITAFVAVAGLLGTMYAQQKQLRQAELNRRDDAVASLAEQFSVGSTPRARLGALAGLASYGSDPRYQVTIRRLILESLPRERDEEVRIAMRRAVIENTDSALLAELADLNRRGSAHLRTVLDTLQALPAQTDSADRESQRLEDLFWNIATLIEAFNVLKTIRNQDFSGITIRVPMRAGAEGAFPSPDFPAMDSTLRFENVSFNQADLKEFQFRSADFIRSTFDRAMVEGTRFTDCTMEAVGFRGIKVHESVPEESGRATVPVKFRNCRLSLTEFSVQDPRWGDQLSSPKPHCVATLERSSWRIEGGRVSTDVAATGYRKAPWNVLPREGSSDSVYVASVPAIRTQKPACY